MTAVSYPGPKDITRVQLPNGIIILARANFNSPSVVISGYLPVGALLDSDEKLGLADFTAVALMRGTERRSFQEIYDALESSGASLGFGGGTHTTSFSGKALAEDLDLLLTLLADALRQPSFPKQQIERLRAQLLTGLAIRSQDTAEMASLVFDELIYANHPYRRPEDGYPETIQAIRRKDLQDFHRRCYGPAGMVITIVGAVETQRVVERVDAFLGDWQNPYQLEVPPLPPVTPLAETTSRRVDIPGKSQADLMMGVPGPERSAPDFLAASLGNNILGQFGLMGRIGDAVREKAGLAYYAYSNLSGGTGPGPWYLAAGVEPSNVTRTIELMQSELARFIREPVSRDELEDSKANYIGRLPLSLETNAGVTGALINLERHELGLDYYQRYPDLIHAITPEDVLAAAQHYLWPDRMGIVVAGA